MGPSIPGPGVCRPRDVPTCTRVPAGDTHAAALRKAGAEPSSGTGFSGQKSMENQLDVLEMRAEGAPRHSGFLSHSATMSHSPRAPAWMVPETSDETQRGQSSPALPYGSNRMYRKCNMEKQSAMR